MVVLMGDLVCPLKANPIIDCLDQVSRPEDQAVIRPLDRPPTHFKGLHKIM